MVAAKFGQFFARPEIGNDCYVCVFVVTVSDGCFCFFPIEEDDGRSRGGSENQ